MKHFYLKSLLLSLFCMIGTDASAYNAYIDGIYYNIDQTNNTAEVTYGTIKYANSVTIPSSVVYEGVTYPVTSIGKAAFTSCTSLTSITLPNSVITIESYAFHYCSGLTNLSIPSSLACIEEGAFEGCTALCKVIVPDLTAWCNIKFYNINRPFNFHYQNSNPLEYAHHLYMDENTEITDLVIPEGVDSIAICSFSGCSGLKSVLIPNSVTYIGCCAFQGCSGMESVSIPSSIKTIDSSAFIDCNNLNVVKTESLSAWNTIDFKVHPFNTKWDDAKHAWVPFYDFSSNPLSMAKHFIIDGKEIQDIVVDNAMEEMKCSFIGFSGLKSITIKSSVKTLEPAAFYGCSNLETVNLPNSLDSIKRSAFEDCSSLKTMVLPNGMTFVGEGAFRNCSNLQTVVIPNTIKAIDKEAFANCMNLYSVTSLINMPFKLDETAFQYTGSDYDKNIIYMAATLYVPRGRTAMYSNIDGWKNFLSIMETDTKFKLTYMVDGEVYKTYEVQATEVITPEPAPYKEGYIFSGWSEIPYLMPAEDVTITGKFTIDPDYNAAVDGIAKDETTPKAYYTIGGRRLLVPAQGLNIVRMSNGTTRKVVVK